MAVGFDAILIYRFKAMTWWQKVLVWNPCNHWRYGAMTEAELRSLSENPYQILKPLLAK